VLDIIHPRRRALQLAINNSVTAVALFLAPILGRYIVQKLSPFYWVFVISALTRLIGITMFRHIKEPIIGGTLLRPLRKIFHLPMFLHLEKSELVANLPMVPPDVKQKDYNKLTKFNDIVTTKFVRVQ